MNACPGLRSGIDRSGSLSFAIRGIPSPFAASLRQSGPPFVIPAKAGIQKGWGGRRTRATLSRYRQFRHNLRSLFDHNLQTRRTNYAQI